MRRPVLRRALSTAALLASVSSCTGSSRSDDSIPPPPALAADLSAQWAVPPGEHVVTVHERDDSSVVVVRESGRITVLNFDLTERTDPASSVVVSSRPVSAATTCTNGATVVVGGSPRALARLEVAAVLDSSDPFPAGLGDVHALSCATTNDVLMLVDPVPIAVEHPSLLRTNTIIVRLRAVGGLDTLATLPGHDFLLHGGNRGWSPPPFAGELRTAVGTTLLYVGITDQPAIQVVQTNGRTVGSIAYVAEGTPVQRSTVDSALRKRLRPFVTDFSTGDYNVMLDSVAWRRVTPPWSVLAADTDDNLWIGTTENAGAATRQWRIFSADGTPMGKLQLPSAFEVTHVSSSRVLGRWRPDRGGEEVRRYLVGRSALAVRGGQ